VKRGDEQMQQWLCDDFTGNAGGQNLHTGQSAVRENVVAWATGELAIEFAKQGCNRAAARAGAGFANYKIAGLIQSRRSETVQQN